MSKRPGAADPASDHDLAVLQTQLGREPRGVIGIAARCPAGHPLVVVTAPRLPDGTPFPTLYYLTEPHLAALIGELEGSGTMAQFTERLHAEPELAARYRGAHRAYLADRAHYGAVPEIEGITAGGMPDRVKCLHALVGHALAAGPGVNPIGDEALTMLAGRFDVTACSCRPVSTEGNE